MPATRLELSRSGKLWAYGPEFCLHTFNKSRYILSRLGFDPSSGHPARLHALLSRLNENGLLFKLQEQAAYDTLANPAATAPDGPLACSLAACPLLPPVDHGTMPYLDPCGVLAHLRGARGWKFVFGAACLGCDPMISELHRPTWHDAPPVPPPPQDRTTVNELLARDFASGWVQRIPPRFTKDLIRAPACTRAVPKADGSFRLIADDSRHNQLFNSPAGRRPVGANYYIRTACLPYPRTPDLLCLLRDVLDRHRRSPGSTLCATADSSKAFKRLRVSAGAAACFTLEHKAEPAYSRVANMGSTFSSAYLNACSACVADALSKPDSAVISFCDDYAILSSLPRLQADQHLDHLVHVLAAIGMPAKRQKTSPCSRTMVFAGLEIFAGSISRPPAATFAPKLRTKTLLGLASVIAGTVVDPDQAAALVGRMRWLTRLLPLLGGLLRPIAGIADAASALPRRSKRWSAQAAAAAAALAPLVADCGPVPLTICPSLRGGPDPFPDLVATIDACKLGFGFALVNLRKYATSCTSARPPPCLLYAARWTVPVPDSVASEFIAACALVRFFAAYYPSSSIRILSDSSTAVAALSSFSPSASATYPNRHIAGAASDLVSSQITCSISHLSAQLNQVADLLSRHFDQATLQPSWPSASRSITEVLTPFLRKPQASLELSFTPVSCPAPIDPAAALPILHRPALSPVPPATGPQRR